ncbi:hypothetical protein ACHAXA_007152 [Cyclostephanos tholiformis]|uniref:AAA+ ATPase domain-containing protein n=1 Tax=Cyclostephanos tholiformis TaxID=382380 RepID=A0ABD3RRN9_9STRA
MLYSEDDEHGNSHDGISMLGIVNALRTGDVLIDMIIAMCVPIILRVLFGWLGRIDDVFTWPIWSRLLQLVWKKDHQRFISFTTITDPYGNRTHADADNHNSILTKAITLYLHQVIRLDLASAYVDLTGIQYDATYHQNDNYDYDDDERSDNPKTLAGQLSRYTIINRLLNNEWYDIGTFRGGKVRLRITRQQGQSHDDKNSQNIENTSFHFMCQQKESIDSFIDTAYRWYLEEIRKTEDNSRHYYEMKISEGKNNAVVESANGINITYKRYKLSDEKSFESLFFPEKRNLLALVDHFSAKTGKYMIKGYPHKLGLLLYGPPGTGKTSLIKALAQYTGRSIVNVPLSRVTTNSQLMSVFFDRQYRIEGSYTPVNLDFRDVIYVMEDCDAASNVVKRRNGVISDSSDLSAVDRIHLPKPKSWWRLFLESQSLECQELVTALIAASSRLAEVAEQERPQLLCSITSRLDDYPELGFAHAAQIDDEIALACGKAIDAAVERKEQLSKLEEILSAHAVAIKSVVDAGAVVNEDFVKQLLGEQEIIIRSLGPKIRTPHSQSGMTDVFATLDHDSRPQQIGQKEPAPGVGKSYLFKEDPDALSLSGLLNVLDGVVDTPGRMVILTSNCPTMLDPALIRPGRVDKQLMLGYMKPECVASMLEHYFQTALTEKQLRRVTSAVGISSGTKLTPAHVEQMTAEHDDLDDMLCALENKVAFLKSRVEVMIGTDHASDDISDSL